jgi:signal transduction histidine kinase
VTLAAERHAGELALTVSDTGIGIPPADQARVFDKFERGDPQARESGAGLGLSLVKNLIELHGGTVTLTSAPGRGTTVSCRLPATPPAAVAADEAAGGS